MWEERWHPLREEWVIVAAHRQSRPWSGAEVAGQALKPPAFDPTCYLCPGNSRVGGAINPAYMRTFVFDNDHPNVALTRRQPAGGRRLAHQIGAARSAAAADDRDAARAM
jgi:galactose-1-phosphate uridylyltransferase